MDYENHQVLATHKSLTTKRDFAIGIENVIAGINIDDPAQIKMVSVSTTLATNAIAEGKGKRVALFLIGYDPELIENFELAHKFATPNFYYFQGGHNLYGQENQPLDLKSILEKVAQVKYEVDAIAVSSYFSPLNPEHENRVYEAISGVCDLPIVLGHQLSTKLGSIERATTAALNASLLAVLQTFLIAVKRTMEKRKIIAPLMVVRGDGTLMSDEFAVRTPVETIHSGPAASAIGGRFLSQIDNAFVVDVGGTTTDLALIVDGGVTISEDGASVSGYDTSVKAADLLSIGLGGDSHIRIDRDGNITVGPERVVPLAFLADQYPLVKSQIRSLTRRTWEQSSPDWLEYWYLIREPVDDHLLETPRQKKVFELLRKSPHALPDLLKKISVFHASQLDVETLFQQEIIGKAGFTPTDLFHCDGRYTVWDAETSNIALKAFSQHLFEEPEEIQTQIWQIVSEKILKATVEFLTRQSFPNPDKKDISTWFFKNAAYHDHPHLNMNFMLAHPLIGIGGPAKMFLEKVSEILNTDFILPPHYQVANAVGAIAGSIMVEEEILVYPKLDKSGLDVIAYFVQTSSERLEIEDIQSALDIARKTCQEVTLSAALRSGADQPQVVVKEISDGLDTYRIQAQAIGKPRLSG
jgi:N-methylhydantoinase A/oxoprolinase/acetone carboxylase beta subunit